MSVIPYSGEPFDFTIPVIVAGAGACGLSAALAARGAGADVLVLERDSVPLGTTSMSSGLIPAAGTRSQIEAGITDDTAERFTDDLMKKTGGEVDRHRAAHIVAASTTTVEWLINDHNIPLTLFKAAGALPGHSRARLHGTPNRTGEELIATLQTAANDAGVDIMTDARVSALIVDKTKRVRAVEVTRPDGGVDRIGCDALILATCGYAANPKLIARYIPEIAGAIVHTHPGAQGDALKWGLALGATTGDLSGYQGHANLAAGHGLLVSWLAVSEGGIQVDINGHRFSDEARGYSEQAVDVAAQAGGFVWTIYDTRIDTIMREIAEYRDVIKTAALRIGKDVADLAKIIGLPAEALKETLDNAHSHALNETTDRFGRTFAIKQALSPPFIAVKVNGALFHTQGGLDVDDQARVLDISGSPLPNLYAGGGAARGLSGSTAAGYVAGNGLMTATTLGRLAGEAAAAQVTHDGRSGVAQ